MPLKKYKLTGPANIYSNFWTLSQLTRKEARHCRGQRLDEGWGAFWSLRWAGGPGLPRFYRWRKREVGIPWEEAWTASRLATASLHHNKTKISESPSKVRYRLLFSFSGDVLIFISRTENLKRKYVPRVQLFWKAIVLMVLMFTTYLH